MEVTEASTSDPGESCKIPLRDKEGNVVDYALVSPEDYERVSQHKWHRLGKENKVYAHGGPDGHWLMHHFIIGRPENDGEVVDHRDIDGLNNARPNLRVTTYSGNSQNIEKRANTSSKYKNVHFNKARKRWVVSIKKVGYGLFPEDQEEAAGKLADKAILAVYGADARTNGLLTEEEKEDVLAGNAPPSNSKGSGLPTGVFFRKDAKNKPYRAVLKFDGVKYELGNYVSVEQAEDAYNSKLAQLKEEKWQKHLLTPIERNADGVAVIDVTNNKGQVVAQALVDDSWWHKLTTSKWNLSGGFAVGTMDGSFVKMHRYILKADRILHLNGNNLDNRDANMKDADHSHINQHRSKAEGLTSKYKGVAYNKQLKKFEVEIRKDGERYKLGFFDLEEDAAKAYNDKASELFDQPFLNVI